jgi:ribosomal protein L24E
MAKSSKLIAIVKEAKKIYKPSKMKWTEAIKKATKKVMK